MVTITPAISSDIEATVACLAAAFEDDPITGFLLQTGDGYRQRVEGFFQLLMRARVALGMPVLVARDSGAIAGAAMGYDSTRPPWPRAIADAWDRFEGDIPGFADRSAAYDAIAARYKPRLPHYYLGVIGTDPARHGSGTGSRLLTSFCARSASDPRSNGVYLETANPANVRFYERAGFEVAGQGALGDANLWCMYLAHARPEP